MIWQLVQSGSQVEIWTICAGDPPAGPRPEFAHQIEMRWKTGLQSTGARRAEDEAACARLGANPVHFDLPDCIYRRLPDGEPLVKAEADLWQPVPEAERPRVDQLTAQIAQRLPSRCRLAAPLALGDHIDHRLLRAVSLRLNRAVHFYPDYPYAAHSGVKLNAYIEKTWRRERFPVSETALKAWQDAVACYTSQISSFWVDLAEMHLSLSQYSRQGGGSLLFRKPE